MNKNTVFLVILLAFVFGPNPTSAHENDSNQLSEQTHFWNAGQRKSFVRKKVSHRARGEYGSWRNPYVSLADAEADQADWDVLYVLPSPTHLGPLDGGILLLDGQNLVGLGPNPFYAGWFPWRAMISNSTSARHDGDAIVLGEGSEVRGIHITDPYRSAINADLAGSAKMSHVLITGHNQNEEVFADGSAVGLSSFGAIHSQFGPGGRIDIANVAIKNGKGHGILVYVAAAQKDVNVRRIRISGIDTSSFENAATAYGLVLNTSEGAMMKASVSKSLIQDINNNRRNRGIEIVGNDTSTARLTVVDSIFKNIPSTGVLEDGAIVPIAFGASVGETVLIAENNLFENCAQGIEARDIFSPDSVLKMQIKKNIFRNIDSASAINLQNFATRGSHVIVVENNYGSGIFGSAFDITNIASTIVESTVTVRNNRFEDFGTGVSLANVGSDANPGRIEKMDLLVEGNEFIDGMVGISSFENGPSSNNAANLDFGGGGLGSIGLNRFVGNAMDASIVSFGTPLHVDAKLNWWGSASGPTSATPIGAGSISTDPFLTSDPRP
ncbi:MAG: hypothetical protein ACR2QT_04850 [Woeseiaceae bacterium]